MSSLIAHRGNIDGPNPARENEPSYILEALANHFQCEVDVRYYPTYWENTKGDKMTWGWYLGHDEGQYRIPEEFLHLPNLWLHLKNIESVEKMTTETELKKLNYFWHEQDRVAITSKGFIWTCDHTVCPSGYSLRHVLMLPDIPMIDVEREVTSKFSMICNDWVRGGWR